MDKLEVTPDEPVTQVALRTATFALMAPLLFRSVHQKLLCGETELPIDTQATIENLQSWLGRALTSG